MQQKGCVPVVLGLTCGVHLLIAVEMCQHQLSSSAWSLGLVQKLFKRPFRLLILHFSRYIMAETTLILLPFCE